MILFDFETHRKIEEVLHEQSLCVNVELPTSKSAIIFHLNLNEKN